MQRHWSMNPLFCHRMKQNVKTEKPESPFGGCRMERVKHENPVSSHVDQKAGKY